LRLAVLVVLLLLLLQEGLNLLVGILIFIPKSLILLQAFHHAFSLSEAHLPSFRPKILVEIVALLKYVSAVALKALLAFLAIVLVLDLVLAVWRGFLAL